MDKTDKITVYNQDNERVGETYRRRAKQLVLKNRAIWLGDEFSAICLTNTADDFNNENKEDEMIYHNNGEVADIMETHTPTEDEYSKDLLMYLAERNIRFRSNLIRHALAFIVVFPTLLILTDGFHLRSNGHFIAGIMFAWGALIAHKTYVLIRSWMSSRLPRHNALTAEYERLKSIPPEKLSYEYKRL